jgi:hypothetical protein
LALIDQQIRRIRGRAKQVEKEAERETENEKRQCVVSAGRDLESLSESSCEV